MDEGQAKSVRIAADRDLGAGEFSSRTQQSFQDPRKFKVGKMRDASSQALALLKDSPASSQALAQIEIALDSLREHLYKAVRAGLNAKDADGKARHTIQLEAANTWARLKMVINTQKKVEQDLRAGQPPEKPEPIHVEMTLKDQTVESIEAARAELRLAAGKVAEDKPVRFVIDMPKDADDPS